MKTKIEFGKQTLMPHVTPSFLWPFIVGIFAIVSFATFTTFVGGDALNGKIENGHFYVRMSPQYKEVSRFVYVLSASLCLFASSGLFLIGNRVLHILENIGFLTKRRLKRLLNLFFGGLCGLIAICSISVIARALLEHATPTPF